MSVRCWLGWINSFALVQIRGAVSIMPLVRGGSLFTAPICDAFLPADAPSAPPFAAWQESERTVDWVSMPKSRSLIGKAIQLRLVVCNDL